MAAKYNYKSHVRNWSVKFFFKATRLLVYRHHYTPDTYRKGMDFFTRFLRNPKQVDYEKAKVGNMEALWVKPRNIDNDSVILYLHGGGYGMGSIKSHRKMVARIARACHTQALMVEYRLAPEHTFPCAVEDSVEAYQWLMYQGFKPQKIVIGGDSAGGGLTIATLLKAREDGLPQPLAGFCMSPWVDLEAASPEIDGYQKNDPFIDKKSVVLWGQRYAGNELRNPLASPIHAELKGIAPLLVQIGTSEILLFENRKFYEKALKENIDIQYEEYVNMIHVFQTFGGFLPQADKAIESIGRFILGKAESGKNKSNRSVKESLTS